MNKTRVLALMGSPRKKKNTDKALGYLLEGMNDDFAITKIDLIDFKIGHCTGCDYCGHKDGCVQRDDMIKLYDAFDNNDIFILAAPLYFNSLNGLTKNIIDRCQKYWSLKYSLGQDYKRYENRRGIFISVGGAPYTHDQFQGTLPIMDFFFKAINANYIGNYFISNTDKVSMDNRENIKTELKEIGKNIININEFNIHR